MNPENQNPVPPTSPTPMPPQPAPQPGPVPLPPQPTPQPTQPYQPYVPPTPPQPPLMPDTGKKGFPKWLKIALIAVGAVVVLIVLFIVVVTAIVNSATKDAQKVSDQIVNDIQSRNVGSLYSQASNAFKQAATQEDLTAVVSNAAPALQGDEKVTGKKIAAETGNAKHALFSYSVATSNGTRYMRVILEDDNGTWKLYNFKYDDSPISLDTSDEPTN